MASRVEVYFNEHGRCDGAWVTLDVNGELVSFSVDPKFVSLAVLYPEEVGTLDDLHKPVDAIIIPPRP